MLLAGAAIDALEMWVQTVPISSLRPEYPAILACIDAYLTSSHLPDADDTDATGNIGSDGSGGNGASLPGASKGKAVRAPAIKEASYTVSRLRRSLRAGTAPEGAQELAPGSAELVRHRMVFLLGSIGGVGSSSLVEACMYPQSDTQPPWVAWDTRKHLAFSLPLHDMKLDVFLDPLLPRVIELTKDASNRRTKVGHFMSHSDVLKRSSF